MHRFTGGRCGSDQHTIYTESAGFSRHQASGSTLEERFRTVRPKFSAKAHTWQVWIEIQHAASLGCQQLRGKKANQAKAAHHKGFTEGGLCKADALKPYGGRHGERSGIIASPAGMEAQRCCGQPLSSACGPLEATRSPTLKPETPEPTDTTVPTLQWQARADQAWSLRHRRW